jgi:hypothetical protein
VKTEPLGELRLKGFQQNIAVYNVLGIRNQQNNCEK